MSEAEPNEVPVEGSSEQWTRAAHESAERGQVVYVTEHGQRLAAIVPPEVAAAGAAAVEAFEDAMDAAAARAALEEPGENIPAEQVWAELGL